MPPPFLLIGAALGRTPMQRVAKGLELWELSENTIFEKAMVAIASRSHLGSSNEKSVRVACRQVANNAYVGM